MGKHTPGPWTTGGELHGFWAVEDGNGRVICQLNGNFTPEANAMLIAAAPDLLALLEEAVKYMSCDNELDEPERDLCDNDCLFCLARAAIARAKGEGK